MRHVNEQDMSMPCADQAALNALLSGMVLNTKTQQARHIDIVSSNMHPAATASTPHQVSGHVVGGLLAYKS
jgi:hypothetical protein